MELRDRENSAGHFPHSHENCKCCSLCAVVTNRFCSKKYRFLVLQSQINFLQLFVMFFESLNEKSKNIPYKFFLGIYSLFLKNWGRLHSI